MGTTLLATEMTTAQIISAILEALFGSFTGTASAVGAALSTFASSIFMNADGSALSTFFIFLLIMSGITLSLSLFRWVLNVITSFGRSRS